jgi:hypothetical protein
LSSPSGSGVSILRVNCINLSLPDDGLQSLAPNDIAQLGRHEFVPHEMGESRRKGTIVGQRGSIDDRASLNARRSRCRENRNRPDGFLDAGTVKRRKAYNQQVEIPASIILQ